MKNKTYIIVRNDDPGALSDPVKDRRVLEIFKRYQVPQVLAVIPRNVDDPHVWHSGSYHPLNENGDEVALLQEYLEKGLVEIAQHGFTHQTNRLRPSIKDELNDKRYFPGIDRKWTYYQPEHPQGYSEFSGLPYDEQEEKVRRGKGLMSKVFRREFESFIFPWNSYDKASLRSVKNNGYKYVPAQDDVYVNTGICVIGCCFWDWEMDEFRRALSEAQTRGKPVLFQFAYHSCFISEETLEEIDSFLQEYSAKENIVFITPKQIPDSIPWAPVIIRLRSFMRMLERRIGSYTDEQIGARKYYINDAGYYLGRIIRYLAALFILKIVVGLKGKFFTRIVKNRLLRFSRQANLIEI